MNSKNTTYLFTIFSIPGRSSLVMACSAAEFRSAAVPVFIETDYFKTAFKSLKNGVKH